MGLQRSLCIAVLNCALLISSLSAASSEHVRAFEFLPEIPAPRQEHAVAILNEKLYIIGGISSNYSYTPDTLDAPSRPFTTSAVQVYDIQEEEWSDVADLPQSINHANVVSLDGKVYLLGGLSGANFSLWGGLTVSYVYDPKTDIWTDIPPLPEGTARGAAAVGVRGREIYLAGGMRLLELQRNYRQESVALVSSYNTETGVWSTAYPPLPEARDHVGGAVIGNKFYVVGGRDQGQRNTRANTWSLDLDDPASGWVTLADMPTARGGLAAAAVGDRIYTFGGEGNPSDPNGVFDNVEVFDITTNTWERLPPLWAGIHGTNAATNKDGDIFIPGGGYRISAAASNFTVRYQPQIHCLD